MKKLSLRIIIISIISIILLSFNIVYAAEAGLVATSSTLGGNISVTLSIPDGARGYSAVVSITYSDGTTSSTPISAGNTSGNLTTEQLTRTVTFPASTIGNATITVSKLLISDENRNQMNSNTTLSTTVQIQDNSTPEPPPVQPADPEEPNDPEEPETPTETEEPTPTPEPKFTSVNDTVYVKSRVNVRESYSTSSKTYGLLNIGTELTRTGIGNNGWTRVEYNGGEAYIYSSYLTTEKPETTPTPTPTEEPTPTPSETPDENEEKEKKAYEKIVKEVGVLPEVGNNLAKYLYATIVIIAILGIIVINKIFKERE